MFPKTVVAAAVGGAVLSLAACGGGTTATSTEDALSTATPIKHVVVLYNENVSFDHYFATYPNAANPAGEPAFTAAAGTPAVDGLSGALLTANPNFTNPPTAPMRRTRSASTAARPPAPTRTMPTRPRSRPTTTARPTCSRSTPARPPRAAPGPSAPRAR